MAKNIEVEFYQRENGQVPVLDFLFSLSPKLRAKVIFSGAYNRTNVRILA